ncbi:MAG: T9SS type A sorting domain-containing protein [Candidatus Pseudobacter hemicellulosilyticus]|uniref:T9SS type A sorting domain-containing protein n=1 Tax=Candidatus Pseudobacter hemicellulosilyticus TaxID=3121375 RepID=A0AAJ6BG62_9BACT|nr:MAG: T9SS type A sorting domain-containing protein [Pseudobacter sp.]
MNKLYLFARTTLPVLTLLLFSTLAKADAVVTNTNASGAGSLAEAITTCNTTPGADVISFAIPGTGPFTIDLTTALPVISGPLFIDGYSQSGAIAGSISGRTILININGSGLPGGSDVFTISSPDVSIAGLAVYSSPRYAVNMLQGANNVHIWGNYFGTNASGTATGLGNGSAAIVSNLGNFGANFNQGVIIGIGNDGINDADDINEGNLIVASGGGEGDGITLWNTRTSTVAGNIIGLNKNADATTGFGNARNGILITVQASGNTIGTNGNGASDALEGNIIGFSGQRGIVVLQSDDNIIAGNLIGLGLADVPAANTQQGIYLLNSSGTRIGTDGLGDNSAEGNTICFNGIGGILVSSESFGGFDGDCNDNVIAGNAIGTNQAATLNGGNLGYGIYFARSNPGYTVNNNLVGSNYDGLGDPDERNLIHNNTGNGIATDGSVDAVSLVNNQFSANSFANNGGLGIDLGNNSVTINDDGDGDVGPNGYFNAPVITSVQLTGSNDLVIEGFSRPNSVIEFYIADAGPNQPAGFLKDFGEGQTLIVRVQDDGSLDVPDENIGGTGTYDGTMEGSGAGGTRSEAAFRFTIPSFLFPAGATINASTRITALAFASATTPSSTSEFSGVATIVVTPVTLLDFSAQLNNKNVLVKWRTTNEVNNSHFEVLKSTDGSLYTSIGTVLPQSGTVNEYSFLDAGITAPVNYYRLKQVDIDGRSTLSKILSVRADLGTLVAKATPNPFSSFLNLSYQLKRTEPLRLRLFNLAGVPLRTYTLKGAAGVNTMQLTDLDNLPKGVYILELSGEQLQFRQQLIKQ